MSSRYIRDGSLFRENSTGALGLSLGRHRRCPRSAFHNAIRLPVLLAPRSIPQRHGPKITRGANTSHSNRCGSRGEVAATLLGPLQISKFVFDSTSGPASSLNPHAAAHLQPVIQIFTLAADSEA